MLMIQVGLDLYVEQNALQELKKMIDNTAFLKHSI